LKPISLGFLNQPAYTSHGQPVHKIWNL